MSLISVAFSPNLRTRLSCFLLGVASRCVGAKSKALALQVKSRSFCFNNDVAGRYAKQKLNSYRVPDREHILLYPQLRCACKGLFTLNASGVIRKSKIINYNPVQAFVNCKSKIVNLK